MTKRKNIIRLLTNDKEFAAIKAAADLDQVRPAEWVRNKIVALAKTSEGRLSDG